MSAGCLLSGSPRPCEPCAQCSSGPGSCRLPFSAFPRHPSWTCGGERSPICCGVVKSERPRGHSSPGSWQWPPGHPSWGGFGRTLMAAVASTTLGLAVQDPSSLLGGKPEAHLFVGVQHRRRDERLFQASSTAIARIVMCNYYVIQVREVIPPPPHRQRRGRRTALPTCPAGRLATTAGTWWCEAL